MGFLKKLNVCRENGRIPALLGMSCFVAMLLIALVRPDGGTASQTHVFEVTFGPGGPGTPAGTRFGIPGAGSVAVDSETHAVYVANLSEGTVEKFDGAGHPVNFTAGTGAGTNKISGFSWVSGEGFEQIAVNPTTHIFYVAEGHSTVKAYSEDGSPALFSAGPDAGGNQLTGFAGTSFGEVGGVAVDPSGTVYVGNYSGGAVDIFAASGAELTSFATGEPTQLAVDSSGVVYVAGYYTGLAGVRRYQPSSFPVESTTTYPSGGTLVISTPALAINVDQAANELYVVERRSENESFVSRVLQFTAGGTLGSTFAGPAEPGGDIANSEGVGVDSSTGSVYLSDTEGERQVKVFGSPPPPPAVPPTVSAPNAREVTPNGADLESLVNPNFFVTTYHFEYLPEAQYESNGDTFNGAARTPERPVEGTSSGRQVFAALAGLTPETRYRYRIVATNQNGSSASLPPEPSFTTPGASAVGLPDARAYELVSPAEKIGQVVPPSPDGFLRLATSVWPGETGTAVQIAPMQASLSGGEVVFEGQPFTGTTSASPNEYSAHRGGSGWTNESLSGPLYENNSGFGAGFKEFSEDLSRSVIYQANTALVPGVPAEGKRAFPNLYLRENSGALSPILDSAPPQRGAAQGTPNRSFVIGYRGANSGAGSVPAMAHLILEANDALTTAVPGVAPAAPAISAEDASTMSNLYEWASGGLHLVNVLPGNGEVAPDAVLGAGKLLALGTVAESAPDVANAISEDGSRVFWTDRATGKVYVRVHGTETLEVPDGGSCRGTLNLTERVCYLTASADGKTVVLSDGKMFQFVPGLNQYMFSVDLTAEQGGFQGIAGASEDLSRIYFVDTEVLAAGVNVQGAAPEPGGFNLYSWHAGALRFVATLGADDRTIAGLTGAGTWAASPTQRTAQTTKNGRILAFMSRAPLTGVVNDTDTPSCQVPGRPTPACAEIFEYNADGGSLICVSCNPAGSRPMAASTLSLFRLENGFPPLDPPQNLASDGSGRIFFETGDSLVPQDTNGRTIDVYEWEPMGIGTCARVTGCISLISTGHGRQDTAFVNSTPSGDDAFIASYEHLVSQDRNDQFDLYDARAPHVAGEVVGSSQEGEGECSGETCKGAPEAEPTSPTAGSSQFDGPGNPRESYKKKHKKKHGKHKKKHPKKKSRARDGNDRKGGSK